MMKKLKHWIALLLSLAIVLSGLYGEPITADAKKSVSITIKKGKSKSLTLHNMSAAKKVKWIVKNKKIAKVTKKSKAKITIKGLKPGKTTVTGIVYLSNKTAKLTVKVKVKKILRQKK